MLVYSVQTSSVAVIELSGIDVFSMKRTKPVGSLIYDSSFLAIGCRSESMSLKCVLFRQCLLTYSLLTISLTLLAADASIGSCRRV